VQEIKDRLSATRFASALLCGRLGRFFQYGGEIKRHPGVWKGKKIHDKLNMWTAGIGEFPKELDHVRHLFPQLDDIFMGEKEFIYPKEGNFEGIPVYLIGYIDMMTMNKEILDLKTGKKKFRDELQLAFYKYLYKKIYGEDATGSLIYSAGNEKVKSPVEIDDHSIYEAWKNIEGGEPKKCEACSDCPIKKDCPLWQKSDSRISKLLSIEKQIKELESEQDDLKDELKNTLEPGTYKEASGSVVFSSFPSRILENRAESYWKIERPPDKFPQYYKTAIDLKELTKDFGVDKQIKRITITLIKEAQK